MKNASKIFSYVKTPAIRTENLTRRYKSFTAVDNLNLAVQTGEIYGFLGSNGAGKTTTMKMLAGLLQPGAGKAWISGHDVWNEPLAAKAALGYVADRSLLYDRLTGREFLAFLAQKGHSYVIYWRGYELIIPIITMPPSSSTSVV